MIRIRQILCPVDFSPFSRRALDHAAILARWYEAELTVVHVSPFMTDARTRVEELVPEEARNWCDPQTRVVCGKPYQEILRIAQHDAADLIVLGVHGRGPIDRMLFGSTTQHVVRQAACPVLTIRP